MSDRLAVLPQYLIPKLALTRFAGVVANARMGGVTQFIIRNFIRTYGVDMDEALDSDPASYASFNDFFTRALKPGARELADADLICPVDGAVSQFGPIERGRILQAKGHDYTVAALLGGDVQLSNSFVDGSFATIYLSPRDYHRIHMPCDGRLLRMIHVPGKLFSVNPTTARGVPGLFARNERVVCVFEHERFGCWVMVLVGATIVGSMATTWHGVVNPPRPGALREWRYDTQDVRLAQGDEMGRFLLGSTVVMLFPKGATGHSAAFDAGWRASGPVRLGERMADWSTAAA